MKFLLILPIILSFLSTEVHALEFHAPQAPNDVERIVEEADTFAEGLWNVIQVSAKIITPAVSQASEMCFQVFCIVMLCCVINVLNNEKYHRCIQLSGCIAVSLVMLKPSDSMISLAMETIEDIHTYSKLLLPVMTGALAAQGATGTSAGLYALTVAFDSILSALIANLLVPILYIYLAFAMIGAISDEKIIHKIKGSLTWCCTWGLKLILYAFLGIMSVTRIVSGATDAAAVKTAKIAISGAVPMVGSIIADASESILLSVSIMKNSAGIYGMLTVLTMFASPILRIGIQYILMNILHWVAQLLTDHKIGKLIEDFSTVLGLLLAMIASQTVFSLISTVCFMKGVG